MGHKKNPILRSFFKSVQTTVRLSRMEMNAQRWTKQGTITSAHHRGSHDNSRRHITISPFSTEVNIIKTTFGCSRIALRHGVVHGGERMKCRTNLTIRQMNEGLEVRNFHGDIRRFVDTAIIARLSMSHFVQFVLNRESFWELFCVAVKSLGRCVSGVDSQMSAVGRQCSRV